MTTTARAVAILVCLLTLSGVHAAAQDPTGTIEGTVTDPSSASVRGAHVVVRHRETGFTRETASGDDGFFRLLALPVGDYIVTVDAPRFTTTVREPVAVNVSQAVRVDVPLALSSVAETVTVAGGASLVETSNTALGRVVTGRELVDLPNINTPESTCFQAIAPSAFYVFASTFPTNNAVANRLATQAGQFGNAGRNIARGPGYTNVDASLVRTFPLAGRSQVQFRWEVFNVFNEVNLGLPVSDLNSPNFGRIFSAGPPRLMQFAVKVLY